MILPNIEKSLRLSLNAQGFKSRFFEVPHARLHAYEAKRDGSLPPLVLLHGVGNGITNFSAVFRKLRKHCSSLLALEAPAHGFSSDPDLPLSWALYLQSITHAINEWVDEIQQPVVIFGHSLGGAMAMRYAHQHPNRVAGLCLLAPGGAAMQRHELEDLVKNFEISEQEQALDFMRRLCHQTPWYSRLIAKDVRNMFDRPVIRQLVDSFLSANLLTPAELRALQMPVLFLWGQSEKIMPKHAFEYFACNLPEHTTIERPANFGHCPQLDQAPELAARIVEFCREVQAGSAQGDTLAAAG